LVNTSSPQGDTAPFILGDTGQPSIPDDTEETTGYDFDETDTQAPVSNIHINVHQMVNTMLVVDWTQNEEIEAIWVEYTFENDEWQATPSAPVGLGVNEVSLLGIPSDTEVTLRLKIQKDGKESTSQQFTKSTDSLPASLPQPTLISYNPELASDHDWVMISVDTKETGNWYGGPYYLLIMDRYARVVWYYKVPDRDACMFPQVSRDQTHIIFDESTSYNFSNSTPQLRRVTLDFKYNETIDIPGFVYGFTEMPNNTILRDRRQANDYRLLEQFEDGSTREIWNCDNWLEGVGGDGPGSSCYTNAVNWSEATDTVLWSLVYHDTVVEIDRESGDVVRVFGKMANTHTTTPSRTEFDFQHYPNWTADGTIMASMHITGEKDQQRAREYTVNDETGELIELWSYGSDIDEYAYYSGEAYKLGNGNVVMNYGTGGAAREVTPDKDVAWDITWGEWLLTGHLSVIEDLYELNRGPTND